MSRLARIVLPCSILCLSAVLAIAAPPFSETPTFDPSTLHLTFSGDPTRSITVQWLGDDNWIEPPQAWTAAEGSDEWKATETRRRSFPLTISQLFQAEVTGLTPDTLYRLRIGLHSPEYRFRTAPATLDKPLTFVGGGDSGSSIGANFVCQQAAKQNPLFVLIGGDIAYANGESPMAWLRYLKMWKRHMVAPDENRLIPIIVTIGNHETNDDDKAPFFFALFDKKFGKRSYGLYSFGDYLRIIALDSGHVDPVIGAQTEWLGKQLEKCRDIPHVFAAYHVPAYPSHRDYAGGTSVLVRKHWLPIMERYPVAAVFEHHDHTYKRTHPIRGEKIDPEGLVFIGDGAWGAGPRTVKSADDEWYIKVSHPALHCIVTTLDGKSRTHTAVTGGGNVIDRYESQAK